MMKMKITDSEIRKIERLADVWQVEMPDESFFINLPAKVWERAEETKRPWLELLVPAGALTALVIVLVLGLGYQAGQMARQQRLAMAAAQWLAEDADWEDIDRVIGQAREANISDLHRYFDDNSLVTAAAALESNTLSDDRSEDSNDQ